MPSCRKRASRNVKLLQYCVFLCLVTYAYYVLFRRDSLRPVDDRKQPLKLNVTQQQRSTKPAPENIKDHHSTLNAKSKRPPTTLTTTTSTFARKLDKKSPLINKKSPLTSKVEDTNNKVCEKSWSTDWNIIEKSGNPSISLDKNRFIYALLANGPNNQLIGLRDTIYLAIRLNRTVILPRFYKHKTDKTIVKGTTGFIPASQRVDVASLAAMISIRPNAELKRICHDGFEDLYFTSHKAMHVSMSRLADDVGVPVHGDEVDEYPKNVGESFNANVRIRSSKESLRNLYDSPGKCALYVSPYRTVGVKESANTLRKTLKEYFTNGLLRHNIDADKTSDADLYALVVHSTPKPKHIAEIVNDFMASYELENMEYLSIHWRYDPIDWQNRCRREDRLRAKNKEFMIEMCEQVKHTQPIDIAHAILKLIRNLKSKSSIHIRALYFAAPLSMEDFIEEVTIEVNKGIEEDDINGLQIFTQLNLRDHLLKYTSCEGLKENYEDVFSQLEMDICSRATVFLRSPSSSWSKVIKETRVIASRGKYDGNIFELAWKMAERRMNS